MLTLKNNFLYQKKHTNSKQAIYTNKFVKLNTKNEINLNYLHYQNLPQSCARFSKKFV